MTKTFKVGDKVRAIDNNYRITTLDYGFDGVVAHVRPNGTLSIKQTKPVDGNVGYEWGGLSAEHFELLDATPTKKQRIQTLESEVEALKARIEALEELHQNAKTPETPNQRRKAVIERAKAFVTDVEKGALCSNHRNIKLGDGNVTYGCMTTIPEYHENKEKRVVTALIKGAESSKLLTKATAKCAPGDVFNVHIGKAIALAKAYGIDCPREFLNAPQPEPAVGQLIKNNGSAGGTYRATGITEKGVQIRNSKSYFRFKYAQILDDSEAQYDA